METIKSYTFPPLFSVEQRLVKSENPDFNQCFARKLNNQIHLGFLDGVNRVALCVGSRGIRHIDQMVAIAVRTIRQAGSEPFIVPAMGSHGGASADGQREVLESLGISELSSGAPLLASMDVVDTGPTHEGYHAYMSRHAYESDAIIVINRVKEHTDFYSHIESGIQKMLAVGLGNHKGASYIHDHGTTGLVDYIPSIARHFIGLKKIMGIALIEDGDSVPSECHVLIGRKILEEEPKLLQIAKKNRASIPFSRLDCLLVEEFGKEISGSGVDCKVVGRIRYHGVAEPESPSPNIICALRLTEDSHGNAAGMGLLDVISGRFFNGIDMAVTRINGVTSKCPERYKIPLHFDTDRETIAVALSFARACTDNEEKFLLIKNTKELGKMYASRALLSEAQNNGLQVDFDTPHHLYFSRTGEYSSLFSSVRTAEANSAYYTDEATRKGSFYE